MFALSIAREQLNKHISAAADIIGTIDSIVGGSSFCVVHADIY
jgi:hypothetical protein